VGVTRNQCHKVILTISVQILLTFSILLLTRPVITYDGWQYLTSGISIFDGSYLTNYFFLRQPLYPLFVGAIFSLTNSIWPIVAIQVFINILAINLFLNTILNHTRFKTIQNKIAVKGCSTALIWFCAGSYPSFILAQNLFTPFICIFISFVIRFSPSIYGKSEQRQKVFLGWLITFGLLGLSYLLAKELFFICLSWLLIYSLNKDKSFWRIAVMVIGSSSLILGLSSSLKNIENKSNSSNLSIIQSDKDIFLTNSLAANLKSRLIEDPPYSQTVIYAALSNLDLAPTMGWDGIVKDKYLNPGHPARFFGLNHFMQSGDECNTFPASGVIAINPSYVPTKMQSCFTSIIRVPDIVKWPLYIIYLLLWPLIVGCYCYAVIRNLRKDVYALFPLVLVFGYAVIGAGISRYGSPVYPFIIIYVICSGFLYKQNRGN
jgi:hypothetical protein